MVNYFALFCLACVVISIFSIYVGVVVHSFLPILSICTLGNVALKGNSLFLVN